MTVVDTDRGARGRPRFHPLTVAARRAAHRRRRRGHLRRPRRPARRTYDFAPGSRSPCAARSTGRSTAAPTRSARPPGAAPRIGVREIPDGLFSRWLVHEVAPGDEVEVQTPTGSFRADPATGGRHLCIAAGSGITPMLSIAGSRAGATRDAEVTLLYGNRTTGSVMFAEELADLKNRHGPRLQLVHVLSREPRDVELFSGRLDADRLRRLLDRAGAGRPVDHVWLCGPFGMIERRPRRARASSASPADRVHFELFYVDEPPPELHRPDRGASRARPATSRSCSTGARRPRAMPRDQSVLDGAQATRSDLPFACKGGVCGTCRAQVVDGRGRHAPQLRPRARRGRGRLRADLPELPGRRRGHRRLRRLRPTCTSAATGDVGR